MSSLRVWNNSLFSCSYDQTIRRWNEKGECISVLTGHTDWVYCLEVWNEFLCSGSWDRTIRVWNENGDTLHVQRIQIDVCNGIQDDPRRMLVLTGSNANLSDTQATILQRAFASIHRLRNNYAAKLPRLHPPVHTPKVPKLTLSGNDWIKMFYSSSSSHEMQQMIINLSRSKWTLQIWFKKAIKDNIIPKDSPTIHNRIKLFQRAEKAALLASLRTQQEFENWKSENVSHRTNIIRWIKDAISLGFLPENFKLPFPLN